MAESDQSVKAEVNESNNKGSAVPQTQYAARSAILDGKFFTVTHLDKDGVKLKAKCNSCSNETVISGSSNALSNFPASKCYIGPISLLYLLR